MRVMGRAVAQSTRVDTQRGASSQRRAPASHALLRIGAARGRWRCPRGRVGRGTDVNELGSVTMPCIASAIEGDGADLRSGTALDVRGRKDYISRLTRSERLGHEVRLVGGPTVAYRRAKRSDAGLPGREPPTAREIEASPPWRAINILGVALMNRSNRIDHIRLTSHPDPNAKVRFPIHWGASSAHERGPIIGTVSRPQDRNVIGSHGGS